MSGYSHVLVGTDGSPTASCAVEAAVTLARSLGATLTVATAWYRHLPDAPPPSEAVEYPGGSPAAHEVRWAERTANDAATRARSAGVPDARPATPEGHPAEALLELSERKPDTLIVVGTAGLTDRTERLLGNIPHQVTHHALRDVLLVHTSDCTDGYSWDRIALATDGSDTAALAVAHGLEFTLALGAEPVLLTAAKDEASGAAVLDRVAGELEWEVGREVVVGESIVDALLEGARGFDLLVLGNKGMSGPSRLLGSIANSVTHALPTDLLLVNTTR
ncbi:MAG: universal stress protein [Actinobacteria bacterium]|nr:universal stress protein [Actinomycetota bacterium]